MSAGIDAAMRALETAELFDLKALACTAVIETIRIIDRREQSFFMAFFI